jgi:uncharacterized membrane protein
MIKLHKQISSDLLIILMWTIVTFVFMMMFEKNVLRTILGIPLILFIPGYVLIAVLFPKKDDLNSFKRIVMSFGMSMVIVPLLGLILNATFGIRFIPILIALCSYSIIFIVVANYRRRQLPEDLRFDIKLNNIYKVINAETIGQSRSDEILTVILLLSIVATIGALIYVTTTNIGERFTEFYILNPSGEADYKTDLNVSERVVYMVGISNHEYSTINYTVNIVLDEDILLSKAIKIDHNQTWEQDLTIIPNKKETDKRLNFLLFKDNNFTEPYRELYLWVNVT